MTRAYYILLYDTHNSFNLGQWSVVFRVGYRVESRA